LPTVSAAIAAFQFDVRFGSKADNGVMAMELLKNNQSFKVNQSRGQNRVLLVGHVWGGELTMSVRATWFVAGVLLASMFWIVLAQQSYCAGSLADWLRMGDVEECQ
jgi:hypothetical protein